MNCFFVLLVLYVLVQKSEAQEQLVELLEGRLHQCSALSWTFSRQQYSGEPADWSNATYDSNPIGEVHARGFSHFKKKAGKESTGLAVFNALDSRCKFETKDANHGDMSFYSDGKSCVMVTQTQTRDGPGPKFVEVEKGTLQEEKYESQHANSAIDFTPFRVIQVQKCFGTKETSLSLADFIGLLRDESTKKKFKVIDGKYFVIFPGFIQDDLAGEVSYRFDGEGALEHVQWQAADFWSPTVTVEYTNTVGPNKIAVPETVKFIEWGGAWANVVNFRDWSIPSEADYGFEIPKDAIVNDHVHQLSYTNVENAAEDSRAIKLYAQKYGLDLPTLKSHMRPAKIFFAVATIFALAVFISRKQIRRYIGLSILLLICSGCNNSDAITVVSQNVVSEISFVPVARWEEMHFGWEHECTAGILIEVAVTSNC